MNNLEKAKEIIKTHYDFAQHGIFNCRNFVGDMMDTIYADNGLMIDICYNQEYFEVFGLSNAEFKELEMYYRSLENKNIEEDVSMNEQWKQLKETIIDIRDNNKFEHEDVTLLCRFLTNYMDVLEKENE